jgi:hypothetical protein
MFSNVSPRHDRQPTRLPPPAGTTDKWRKLWYRRWWAITLGALIVVFVLVGIFSGDTDTPTTDEPAAETTEEPAATALEPEPWGVGSATMPSTGTSRSS